MKIINFTIENFKSIEVAEVNCDSEINMIFGHNNSGKSNLLKFIHLLFSPKISGEGTSATSAEGDVLKLPTQEAENFWDGIITNQPYIFRNNSTDVPIKFNIKIDLLRTELKMQADTFSIYQSTFFNRHERPSILLDIKGSINWISDYDSRIKLEEVELDNVRIYSGDTGKYFESITTPSNSPFITNGYTAFKELIGNLNNSVILLDNDRFFNIEQEDKTVDELTPKTFKNWFHNSSMNNNFHKNYQKIISQIKSFHPRGDHTFNAVENNSPINSSLNFEYVRNQEEVNLMLSNSIGQRLPLESFGTGVQQILYILSKISEKSPSVLIVEELELNLSPMYQNELLQHILLKLIRNEENNLRQVFFTTHSPVLCYRADFKTHQVAISNRGITTVTLLGDDKNKIADFYTTDAINFLIEQRTRSTSAPTAEVSEETEPGTL